MLTVTIVDPCVDAILTIDDTVFKTVPAITLTQFLDYAALQVNWTDAIVTSSKPASEVSICGAYTYEILDISTGTE